MLYRCGHCERYLNEPSFYWGVRKKPDGIAFDDDDADSPDVTNRPNPTRLGTVCKECQARRLRFSRGTYKELDFVMEMGIRIRKALILR